MSIDAMSWAFRAPGVKDAYEKVVLLTLADFADDYGVCFPAVATIAERASCSVRKTRYCLAALEERGLILGISRRRSNGSQRSSAFILIGFGGRKIASRPDEHPVLEHLHLEGRLPPETIRLHAVPPAEAGQQTARQVVADCTACSSRLHDRSVQTAQRAALEPSLEPPIEPSQEPPPIAPPRSARRKRKEIADGEASTSDRGDGHGSYSELQGRGWARAIARANRAAADRAGSGH